MFRTFPDVPISIEIKGDSDTDVASFLRNREAALGRGQPLRSHRSDRRVVQRPRRDPLHQLAPQTATAPGITGILAFWALGIPPGAGARVLQVPIEYNGITVTTPEFVQRAHDAGLAVHVWLSAQEENAAVYNELVDMCVDGIMPAEPSALEAVLDDRGIERPGQPGVDPCA